MTFEASIWDADLRKRQRRRNLWGAKSLRFSKAAVALSRPSLNPKTRTRKTNGTPDPFPLSPHLNTRFSLVFLFPQRQTRYNGARQSTSAKFSLARCRSRFGGKSCRVNFISAVSRSLRSPRDSFQYRASYNEMKEDFERTRKKNSKKKRKKETQLERNRKNWGSSFVVGGGREKIASEIFRRLKIY